MIEMAELVHGFHANLPVTLSLLRDFCGVRQFDLVPRAGTPLALPAGATPAAMRLHCDKVIARQVLRDHAWQVEELNFAKAVMPADSPFALVDVGANMGLFSRQFLVQFPNLAQVWAYEPNPDNHALLLHNLAFSPKVQAHRVALSDSEGQADFYEEQDNCGNYSLNSAAMPPEQQFKVARVQTRAVATECLTWHQSGLPLFYKSDTQGFDEKIACALPDSFWPSVKAGILELWRIDKPEHSRERLRAVLDQFPRKIFLRDPRRLLATDEILAFLDSQDRNHHDLGFWRP
ncbi:FkbM family methyltransferase [Aquabacterium sp. OR-4]|uniref:FkbM family methyltransferase n=1 Tax=Aquabacterium sp. OR-4 TaxID=2978127 RepID=UPI0021B4B46E|nr:FkbM family methyltransferase [Aquabacterium sp. OR-4]MDT7836547.1 FkbM family methyltransferase [Aquabacterium sp. OR-4]